MVRLNRSRKGKTAIDVTTTLQDGNKRIRITLGEPLSSNKRNTDLDITELRDLITLLQFHELKMKGEVPWDA
jgi:hypothetical protein